MKLEQAARQALEALKWSVPMGSTREAKQQYIEAYAALRDALAEQAEQEPMAWGRVFDGDIIDCICSEEHALNEGCYTTPLYAAPVRTKDLTDDEIATVYEQDEHHHGEFNYRFDPVSFARAVIAADREKNSASN